jgi:hypothetical protein
MQELDVFLAAPRSFVERKREFLQLRTHPFLRWPLQPPSSFAVLPMVLQLPAKIIAHSQNCCSAMYPNFYGHREMIVSIMNSF